MSSADIHIHFLFYSFHTEREREGDRERERERLIFFPNILDTYHHQLAQHQVGRPDSLLHTVTSTQELDRLSEVVRDVIYLIKRPGSSLQLSSTYVGEEQ